MTQAFALRADQLDTYEGGVINVAGTSVNIKQLLDDGSGVIRVEDDNPLLQAALNEYPALKSVPLSYVAPSPAAADQTDPDDALGQVAPEAKRTQRKEATR
jgi:hypothetical protein